jgi:hypothetical protein
MMVTGCNCTGGGKSKGKSPKSQTPKSKKDDVVKKDSKKADTVVTKKPSINNYKNINQKRKDSLLLIKAEFCPHCRDFVKKYWVRWTTNPSKHINLISFDVATNNYRDEFLAKVIAKSPYVPAMYYVPKGSKGDDVIPLDISNTDRIEDLIYTTKK